MSFKKGLSFCFLLCLGILLLAILQGCGVWPVASYGLVSQAITDNQGQASLLTPSGRILVTALDTAGHPVPEATATAYSLEEGAFIVVSREDTAPSYHLVEYAPVAFSVEPSRVDSQAISIVAVLSILSAAVTIYDYAQNPDEIPIKLPGILEGSKRVESICFQIDAADVLAVGEIVHGVGKSKGIIVKGTKKVSKLGFSTKGLRGFLAGKTLEELGKQVLDFLGLLEKDFIDTCKYEFRDVDGTEYIIPLQKWEIIEGVENKSPNASITTPSDGSIFIQGEPISFQGLATDPEEGALTGASLVWESSIDGQIGTGGSFTTDTLSSGTHTITLTATDSQGAVGTDSITLTIEEPPTLLTHPWPMFSHDSRNSARSDGAGALDGKVRWTTSFSNPLFGTPVVAQDGTIYIGTVGPSGDPTQDGQLAAINPVDGFVKWESPVLDAAPFAPALGATGTIYTGVQRFGNTFYALDPADGSIQWQQDIGPVRYTTITDNNLIIVGIASGNTQFSSHFVALDTAGAIQWTFNPQFNGDLSNYAAVSPDGATVYITEFDSGIFVSNTWLHAVDASSGAVNWSQNIASALPFPPSVASDGTIYVPLEHSLLAINPDGSSKWQKTISNGVLSIANIAPNGSLILATQGLSVDPWILEIISIDPFTQAIEWRFQGGEAIAPVRPFGLDSLAGAIGFNNVIYISTTNSGAELFAIQAGSQLWSFGGEGQSFPAIGTSGALYVVLSDGTGTQLYAFE